MYNEEPEEKGDIRSVDTTVLAYIGDAVYELYVRKQVMEVSPLQRAGKLHKISVRYVSFEAQASALRVIEPSLTEEEKDIVRRARNKKSTSRPQRATPVEYKLSTAFEALIGYLYMNQDQMRAEQVMKLAMAHLGFRAAGERNQAGHEQSG